MPRKAESARPGLLVRMCDRLVNGQAQPVEISWLTNGNTGSIRVCRSSRRNLHFALLSYAQAKIYGYEEKPYNNPIHHFICLGL